MSVHLVLCIKKWARALANVCRSYAAKIAAVTLARTSIEQGEPVEEVLGRLQQSQMALSPVNGRNPQRLFVPAPNFVAQAPEQTDWLVEGVIERGANGFFVAQPKGGKSWAAIDLALSLPSVVIGWASELPLQCQWR